MQKTKSILTRRTGQQKSQIWRGALKTLTWAATGTGCGNTAKLPERGHFGYLQRSPRMPDALQRHVAPARSHGVAFPQVSWLLTSDEHRQGSIVPAQDLRRSASASLLLLAICAACISCSTVPRKDPTQIPPSIQAIFDKPFYKGATWGLRVIDPDKNEVLLDYGGDHQYFIGSVRKVFTVGALLDTIGPSHTYDTPIYRRGKVDAHGVLQGDLILVASGDLTMGGRTNP